MIIIRRTYVPKPGQGGKLLSLVRQAGEAMATAGFNKPRVLRTAFGDHGTVITEQIWGSLSEYDASRETVRQTREITEVFEQIYPLLASTHHTEALTVVED
ncbi:MAG: hypothetical protein ACOC5K_01255 [Chloroflexota bacterium]